MNDLRRRRQQIDDLDDQVARLLLERRRLAASVVTDRLVEGGRWRDPEREREIIQRLADRAAGAELRHLRAVYRVLLDHAHAAALMPGVEGSEVLVEAVAHPQAAANATRVVVGEAIFSAGGFELIAGPCAVEDEAQLLAAARAARAAGAKILRGGAFKPRTV